MSGLGLVSEGKAVSWFGEGQTTVKVKSSLDITYGATTTVVLGITNRYTLAATTAITAGSKFDASLSIEYAYKNNKTRSVSGKGTDLHALQTFTSSVGSTNAEVAKAKTLKTATYALMIAQTVAILATTALATTQAGIQEKALAEKKKKENEQQEAEAKKSIEQKMAEAKKKMEEDAKKTPEQREEEAKKKKEADMLSATDQRINIALWAMSNITTTASALFPLFLALSNKWKDLNKTSHPAGVLTLDATGGVFLGTRTATPPNATSGVFINSTGVELSSAASGMDYDKPGGGTTILGVNPEAQTVGGAQLKVSNDGVTRIKGKGIRADLKNNAGVSTHVIYAQKHMLNVTQANSLVPAGPALTMTDRQAQLKADNLSSVSIKRNVVNALAGGAHGSSMRLTNTESSLGTGGNNITINASGVVLSFGQTKLKVDATGVTVGGELTVLHPGAPGMTFSGLQSAVADVTEQAAEITTVQTQQQALETKFAAMEALIDTTNRTLVETRERLDSLTEDLPST